MCYLGKSCVGGENHDLSEVEHHSNGRTVKCDRYRASYTALNWRRSTAGGGTSPADRHSNGLEHSPK
jgi:hypothetical protein